MENTIKVNSSKVSSKEKWSGCKEPEEQGSTKSQNSSELLHLSQAV